MTRDMKRFVLVVMILWAIWACTQSYASWSIGPIAPAVANCPAGVAGDVSFCPVGTSSANYALYVNWNNGGWVLFQPGGGTASYTGTAPIVVNGTVISCPTCGPVYTATSPVVISGSTISLLSTGYVASFNTRTGPVGPLEGDYAGLLKYGDLSTPPTTVGCPTGSLSFTAGLTGSGCTIK